MTWQVGEDLDARARIAEAEARKAEAEASAARSSALAESLRDINARLSAATQNTNLSTIAQWQGQAGRIIKAMAEAPAGEGR